MVLAGAGDDEVSVGDAGPPGIGVERFGGDEDVPGPGAHGQRVVPGGGPDRRAVGEQQVQP